MAEFSNACAKHFGLEPELPPFLCEGCGQQFERPSLRKWLLKFFSK